MITCETVSCQKNNVDHGVKFSWSAGKYLCLEHDIYRSNTDQGYNYYTKRDLSDGKDKLKMSPAEYNDIVSRKVNPDGSVSKTKRTYIDLGLQKKY